MKRKYRKILVFFIALIMLCIITLLVVKFFHGLKKPQNVSVVDTIKNYDYALEDRDTVLYKNLYQQLKEVLEEDKIDEDAYSKLVVQMFIADLFTLDNKMSKYDVGGFEFVYPDALEKYKIAVEESIYKTVENNSDGKRKQDLPIVSEVNVEDGTKSTFKIGEEEKESLEFKATWSYEEDYGYDKAAKVTLVKVDDKFFVVEYKVEE